MICRIRQQWKSLKCFCKPTAIKQWAGEVFWVVSLLQEGQEVTGGWRSVPLDARIPLKTPCLARWFITVVLLKNFKGLLLFAVCLWSIVKLQMCTWMLSQKSVQQRSQLWQQEVTQHADSQKLLLIPAASTWPCHTHPFHWNTVCFINSRSCRISSQAWTYIGKVSLSLLHCWYLQWEVILGKFGFVHGGKWSKRFRNLSSRRYN